jgi:hypothetical protein
MKTTISSLPDNECKTDIDKQLTVLQSVIKVKLTRVDKQKEICLF